MAFQFRKPFNIKDNAFDPDGHKYVYKVPKGNYLLKLLKSDKTKPTKQGEVPVAIHTYEILDGPDQELVGRWLKQWLHFWDDSKPGAVRYAAGKFSQVCDAIGVDSETIRNTKMIEGKKLACSLKMGDPYGDEGRTNIEYVLFYPAASYESKNAVEPNSASSRAHEPEQKQEPEDDGADFDDFDDDNSVPW